MPFDAPTKPVVAAFNDMLVKLYNMIADLKGFLEDVNAADSQVLQAILDQEIMRTQSSVVQKTRTAYVPS